MHCIRLNWGLVRFGKWGRERIQKSYVDMQLMINIQLTWEHREILSKCLVTFFLLVLQLHQLHHVAVICPVGTMSHPYLYFQKYFCLAPCLLKIHWIKLAFQVLEKWFECLVPPWFPVHSTVLFLFVFVFIRFFPLDVWIPRPSIMASRGGGRLAGASWPSTWRLWALGRGMLCPHPPCSLLRLFPCECLLPLSQDSLMPFDWLYVILDSSWVIKIILIWPLPVSVLATYMGCFPRLGSVCPYFIPSAPQLSKCCVALSICLGPLLSGSIG